MLLLPDTRLRHVEPELMDDPALRDDLHRHALRGLARINTLSKSAASVYRSLIRLVRAEGNGPVRVLDMACGGGDMATSIERIARRDGTAIRVDGCDVSPTAINQARRCAQRCGSRSNFFRCDVLQDPLPTGYHAIVSNLFLHHLSDDQAVTLLSRMADATNVIVINDLNRSPLGYVAARLGTRMLSRSPIVHIDGPRSVRGAFTVAEARDLAKRADLRDAKIVRLFPFRWLLTWSRA